VTTFSNVERYLGKLLIGGVIGSVLVGFVLLGVVMYRFDLDGLAAAFAPVLAIALPLFLFLGLWRASGLQRTMILYHFEEFVDNIGERLETAVEEWKRTGNHPPTELLEKQLSGLAKYSPEHPSVLRVAEAIRQAKLEVPRGAETS